jgi:Rod binding domain-containing protein
MDIPGIANTYTQDLTALQARFKDKSENAQPGQHKPVDRTGKLYQACVDFESIFIKQMLDAMRKTVDKSDGLLERSMSQDIFEDMLYDEYAKKMAQNSTFKLADMMYNQLSKYS